MDTAALNHSPTPIPLSQREGIGDRTKGGGGRGEPGMGGWFYNREKKLMFLVSNFFIFVSNRFAMLHIIFYKQLKSG